MVVQDMERDDIEFILKVMLCATMFALLSFLLMVHSLAIHSHDMQQQ